MSSVLDRSHNPRKLVKVQVSTTPVDATGGDFSHGLPFMYVDPTGVAYPRRDAADAPYTFMSVASDITDFVSIDMEARRQIKSIDSTSFIPILEQLLTGASGFTGPTISNLYVYRSAFAKLYQATTLRDLGITALGAAPPQFVSADTLAGPAAGSQTVGSGTYSGYSMPAHTYWAADTPLVLEFTDDGDGLVKYITIHNPATRYNNVAYTTMN